MGVANYLLSGMILQVVEKIQDFFQMTSWMKCNFSPDEFFYHLFCDVKKGGLTKNHSLRYMDVFWLNYPIIYLIKK